MIHGSHHIVLAQQGMASDVHGSVAEAQWAHVGVGSAAFMLTVVLIV
jgi:hypothetical protein